MIKLSLSLTRFCKKETGTIPLSPAGFSKMQNPNADEVFGGATQGVRVSPLAKIDGG